MENLNYKLIMCIRQLKHGGGAILVWGCMTSCDMGYMFKIEGTTTQTLYLGNLQDGVMETLE